MTTPLVSVIIPNYCHSKYLDQRIQSVLNQTYSNFEVIILDDCSPDNGASREVIETYRNDRHISNIIYNDVNSGSTFRQWQKGFELAKGKLIWIAESDDYCENDFLEQLVKPFNPIDSTIAVSVGGTVVVDGDGMKIRELTIEKESKIINGKKFISKRLSHGGMSIPNASAVVFKRDIAISIDKSYMDYEAVGDRLFWILMLEKGDIALSNKYLNYFRQHPNKVTPYKVRKGITFFEEFKINQFLTQKGYINGKQKFGVLYYYRKEIDRYEYESDDIKKRIYDLWFPHWWQSKPLLSLFFRLNCWINKITLR